MNIGIHFFDLLLWLFGPVKRTEVYERSSDRLKGRLELAGANVNWSLSIDVNDLPEGHLDKGLHAYRALTIGEDAFDFSSGFDDLHTRVYEDIISGGGFRIQMPDRLLSSCIAFGLVILRTPELVR